MVSFMTRKPFYVPSSQYHCSMAHYTAGQHAGQRLLTMECFFRSRQKCEDDDEAILIGVLASVSLIILVSIVAIICYHRSRRTPTDPFQHIAHVRSKVYTRIYSKEKYERPMAKKDLVVRIQDLLHLDEVSEAGEAPRDENKFDEGAALQRDPITLQGMVPVPQQERISAEIMTEFADLEQLCFHTIQGCQ